ncbi:MAG: DUF3108 domain-containing protein [Bacteroidales bacterium]|nr:DUF3108 domain-containing protein [Bacteroidales bacterium]MBN2819588.1 DUF3108 domain-containing protein [Bacteroidales bacterium]
MIRPQKNIDYRMSLLTLFVVIACFSSSVKTTNAQCLSENKAYTTGEVLDYSVYYNWGIIWLDAGYVSFKVKKHIYLEKPVYHFDSYGSTHKSYDWLFKVRDRYQSYLDTETLLPLWFHRENYEGGFEVDYKYFFDWNQNRVFSYTQNSNRPYRKDTVYIPDCTYDVLSLIYYCRNLDFDHLEVNDTVPVKAIIDNEVYSLYVRYLGKEKIEDRNDHTYNAIKFSALLVEGTIFKGGEDLIVWVTDDKNRVPILVEAKILIGSVKAYFNNASGLRNPMAARLK